MGVITENTLLRGRTLISHREGLGGGGGGVGWGVTSGPEPLSIQHRPNNEATATVAFKPGELVFNMIFLAGGREHKPSFYQGAI